jgi:hypothetical protein
MSRWKWNVVPNSTRRGSRSLPIQAPSQLYHCTSRILALGAAQGFSVVMVFRLFGIARKTFYKYRPQAAQGSRASFACTPRVHGLAKPPHIVAAGLRAKAPSPGFGKPRRANVLYHPGVLISPTTVQRIVREPAPAMPSVACLRRRWHAWEALAPDLLWAMAIG